MGDHDRQHQQADDHPDPENDLEQVRTLLAHVSLDGGQAARAPPVDRSPPGGRLSSSVHAAVEPEDDANSQGGP